MDKDDLSQLEKQELLLRRGKIPSGPQRATFAFAGSVKILSNSSGREADVANFTVCYFLGSRSEMLLRVLAAHLQCFSVRMRTITE